MWLNELEADRLRNLRAVGLALAGGLTVFTGRNGQGKSSLLEAVYLLATGRSFRTRRLEEVVCWNGGPLCVAGSATSRVGRTGLKVVIDGADRRLVVDGAETDLESFLGRLDVVDLTAERMGVLRAGPDERRRFLDRGIVGLRPSYLRALGEYRRVLQQRNALLRASSGGGTHELAAWDERLVAAATEIHRRRREYAVLLGAELGATTRTLFPQGGEIAAVYRPSPQVAAEREVSYFSSIYEDSLQRSRRSDLEVGYTRRGPHRDELVIELEGVDLRRFGSAGQVRGAMIALKLGKLSLLQKQRGEMPVFLMDDFDSDLDEVRARAVAEYLVQGGCQALVATSKEGMADRLGVPFKKVLLSDGKIRET